MQEEVSIPQSLKLMLESSLSYRHFQVCCRQAELSIIIAVDPRNKKRAGIDKERGDGGDGGESPLAEVLIPGFFVSYHRC
jgi:hypothetical protein